MHAALNSVIVGRYPHRSILIHLSAASIEQIIIVTNLCEPFCSIVIVEIIGRALNIHKTIADNISVLIAQVLTGFQSAPFLIGITVDVAAGIYINLAESGSEDYSIFNLYCAIERLAIFVAIVKFAFVTDETIAQPCHQACFLIEVIPGSIHDIISNRRCISIGNIAVTLDPVDALFQSNESAEPRLTSYKIFGTIGVSTECASY